MRLSVNWCFSIYGKCSTCNTLFHFYLILNGSLCMTYLFLTGSRIGKRDIGRQRKVWVLQGQDAGTCEYAFSYYECNFRLEFNVFSNPEIFKEYSAIICDLGFLGLVDASVQNTCNIVLYLCTSPFAPNNIK